MSALDSRQSINPFVGTKRYMPGLDGLRALSVIAVIAYHLNFPWAAGGFLGVGIFFTLSGYLITDQLMMQWQKLGRIDLKNFWIRRFRRLMPAMFFMLAIVLLWLALLEPSRVKPLQGDFVSVALYFNNWWLIFHNISYFESFGPQSPIGHLWSLAIEEQFYLLWPVILMVVLRFVQRRRKLILFILAGAAASVLAMGLIYEPGADPSRVYYGTDTRAFALLIGAAFAVAYPSCKLSEKINARWNLTLDVMGGLGLLGVLMIIWKTNQFQSSLYYGELAVFSVLSAVVIVILAHPASRMARLIGCKPLRWIGVRSYGLYLWHYPVIVLTSPTVDTGGFDAGRIVLQVVLSFLLAALSWKFVEEPIRRGAFTQVRGNKTVLVSSVVRRSLLVISATLLTIFIIPCSAHLSGEYSSPATLPASGKPVEAEDFSTDNEKLPPQTADSGKSSSDIPEPPTAGHLPAKNPPVAKEAGNGVIAIGDSIILDAAPYLEKLLPGIIIDGKVSRQMSQAQEVIDQLKADGKYGNRIIIELGTNGPFNTKQFRQMLSSLGDMQQIILVNTRVPRNWQDTVNSDLEKIAAEFPNTTLVDWFSASKGKDSFFYDDGVHLKQEGASYYAALISEAVQKENL